MAGALGDVSRENHWNSSLRTRVTLCLAAALIATGCAKSKPRLVPRAALTVVNSSELPPPVGIMAGAAVRPFRLGAFDKVSVSVYGIPELTQATQIDTAGRISVPLAGQFDAAGMTPDELSRQIAARLRQRFVRNPQVTVNVDETSSQVVTIDGQVAEPGVYPVVGRMTLVRAIASAKGTAEFAKLDDVVVFRKVGDQQMAALYNLSAIRSGAYEDPEIYANDTIVVGDSPSRRLFRDILQASPLFITPLIALLNRR